jgi:hypothetical protein
MRASASPRPGVFATPSMGARGEHASPDLCTHSSGTKEATLGYPGRSFRALFSSFVSASHCLPTSDQTGHNFKMFTIRQSSGTITSRLRTHFGFHELASLGRRV